MSSFSFVGIFGFLRVDTPMANFRECQFASFFGDDIDGGNGSFGGSSSATPTIQHATAWAVIVFIILCLLGTMIQYGPPCCQSLWSCLRSVATCVWTVLRPTYLYGVYDSIRGLYFPFNRPSDTVIRISLTLAALLTAYSQFLLPVVWYLSGFSEGLNAASWELSPYCWDARELRHRRFTAKYVPVEHWFCLGEEASLESQARFVDLLDPLIHPNFDDDNMHHFGSLTLGLYLLGAMIIFSWWLHQFIVEEQLFSQEELIERVLDYRSLACEYEAVLNSRSKDLATAIEGQGAWKGLLDGALSRIRRLEERVRSGRFYESTNAQLNWEKSELQQKLRSTQFQVMDLTDEVTMYPNTRSDVIKLEEQLAATEQMEAHAQEESNSLREQLAAVQKELTAANRLLTAARNEKEDLQGEKQALSARCEGLQNSHDILSEQHRVLGTDHSLVVSQRDQAVSRVNSLQAQLVTVHNELQHVQSQQAPDNILLAEREQCEQKIRQYHTKTMNVQSKASGNYNMCAYLRAKLVKSTEDFLASQETSRQLQRENQLLRQRLANLNPSGGSQAPTVRMGDSSVDQRAYEFAITFQDPEMADLTNRLKALRI